MDTTHLLVNLLLGGLLGMLGQGIRVLAGLRKMAPEAPFDGRRLWVSLLLGLVAGALGVVSLLDANGNLAMGKDTILTLLGIGYAGTDFIESLLTRYVQVPNAPNGPRAARVGDQPAPAYTRVARLPYSSEPIKSAPAQ